jgi:hypothetical protein
MWLACEITCPDWVFLSKKGGRVGLWVRGFGGICMKVLYTVNNNCMIVMLMTDKRWASCRGGGALGLLSWPGALVEGGLEYLASQLYPH